MKDSFFSYGVKSSARAAGVSILILAASCTSSLAQPNDLFVSFYNTDTVSLYDAAAGGLLNANFASVQSPIGLAIGPGQSLYVGSDNLSGSVGAGIVSFGINGTTSTPGGTFVNHVGDNALNNPQGLVFSGGNLYAADLTAGEVFLYNSVGAHINTLSSPLLNGPTGLALGPSGTIYIADQNTGDVLKYAGGTITRVNSQLGAFIIAKDVTVGPDGNLYVLNWSGIGSGIYKLNIADGSVNRIVDYSTSPFNPNDMVIGPDQKLYVSGVDGNTGDGNILQIALDGSSSTLFTDTGPGTMPGNMVFDVPEPSALTLAGLSIGLLTLIRFRCNKRTTRLGTR